MVSWVVQQWPKCWRFRSWSISSLSCPLANHSKRLDKKWWWSCGHSHSLNRTSKYGMFRCQNGPEAKKQSFAIQWMTSSWLCPSLLTVSSLNSDQKLKAFCFPHSFFWTGQEMSGLFFCSWNCSLSFTQWCVCCVWSPVDLRHPATSRFFFLQSKFVTKKFCFRPQSLVVFYRAF